MRSDRRLMALRPRRRAGRSDCGPHGPSLDVQEEVVFLRGSET